MQLNIGLLGYNNKLSHEGLAQLARNNPEQILKCDIKQGYLVLKDGTHIKALIDGDLDRQIAGSNLDQLILFDDNRWFVEWDKSKSISIILGEMEYRSRVPKEFRIIKYEDVR